MSYIVCFWDKSRLQVSDDMGEKLKFAKENKTHEVFTLQGSQYSITGIDKILKKNKAFDVFPADWDYLKNLTDELPEQEFLKLNSDKKLLTK